jgi:hypothetical protein
MDDRVLKKKVMNGKFHGSRPVGRSRLRRDDISRDSLLAAENKRLEEVIRGQEHLGANY